MSPYRRTEEGAVGHLGGRMKCSNGWAAEFDRQAYCFERRQPGRTLPQLPRLGMKVAQEWSFNVRDMCNFK
jgi:hypothetical protein